MEQISSSATCAPWLYRLLDENSTKRYKMEYQDGLSNHTSHAIISLYKNGCSENRIKAYLEWYSKRLVEVPAVKQTTTKLEPDSLLGQSDLDHFDDLVDFYKSELEKVGDIKGLVGQHFPKLASGMFTSALHGLIELGYGISVNSPLVVCQGLAYIHYAYIPIKFEEFSKDLAKLGTGNKGITNVLDDVRENLDLRRAVVRENHPKYPKTNPGQKRIWVFLELHTRKAMDYVYSIQFPDLWNPDLFDFNQAIKICDWIIDCAITTYVASETKNDFLLIHAVTGAWSFKHIVTQLDDKTNILKAIQIFLCTFLAVYITVHCPRLNLDKFEEPKMSIEECIGEALKENMDEHVYKLMQVCSERSRENPLQKDMYISACNEALKYPLNFLWEPEPGF